MGKLCYEPPTPTFPFRIKARLNQLSRPQTYDESEDDGHGYTACGIRISALRAVAHDRINDAAWPPVRRLMATKREYKNRFTPERLQRIDRMIELSNATLYAKLANVVIDLKGEKKDVKRKRVWSDSDWKKHMDYIGQIAGPKKIPEPTTVDRGPAMPIEYFFPKLSSMALRPPLKVYRRLSKESWYQEPGKVTPAALKYVISDRVKKLAVAKVVPEP